MSITEELVTPAIGKFGRLQWFGAATVMGFFLGFVDTLLIAALLGWLHITLPAYMGVPTTFTGYFFTGMIMGNWAPKSIEWEPVAGILICVLFLMIGQFGLSGHGFFMFLFHFVLIPGVAMAVCYLGMETARRKAAKQQV